MNQFITITGIDDVTHSATEQARQRRDALLAKIYPDTLIITDAVSAESSASLLKEIKNFTSLIEAGRTDVKAPVIALGKQIDSLARELTAQLEAEALKISKVLGAWQAEQNRIAEKARRDAQEDEARLAREVAENERKFLEAEKARIEELNAKAERARTPLGRAKAEAEIAVVQQQAQDASDVRRDAVVAQVVAIRTTAAQAAPPKTLGMATREEIMVEVLDITALYAHSPSMVKLEVNVAALKAVLKANPKMVFPGVRHWKEAKTVVR